ncbi:Uncharacterised protein [Mycobacteroides abscessus subsp. abscessus]|nr:Uncharacterised protein [Mycobacteroides abscessus subsp. abscessus]
MCLPRTVDTSRCARLRLRRSPRTTSSSMLQSDRGSTVVSAILTPKVSATQLDVSAESTTCAAGEPVAVTRDPSR